MLSADSSIDSQAKRRQAISLNHSPIRASTLKGQVQFCHASSLSCLYMKKAIEILEIDAISQNLKELKQYLITKS